MKKILLLLILAAGARLAAHGEIRLPGIVGDHMVLQQQSRAALWGWAKPGGRVTVGASWGESASVEADGQGRWRVELPTPGAGCEPYEITVADGDGAITLHDVLVGEVWFCSGQSNMEMPLGGFWNQPVEGANGDIVRAERLPMLRMATVARTHAQEPAEDAEVAWEVCSSRTAPRFSATAFYFARLLHETLGVPVGVINSSWGGSKIEGWMPREIVAGYADIDLAEMTGEVEYDYLRPVIMYNGLLYPMRNYTIRGFVWYQGCSNVGAHAVYAERMAAMVAHWRGLWGDAGLPFYFAEIAPYRYGDADAGAYLREAQHRAARMIPNSGIVSTSDLVKPYEEYCIHPSRKREAGERLACMALNRTYGYSGIACDSPVYKSMERCGDGSVVLAFDHADDGFDIHGEPTGFEAAGADGIFRPAEAELLFAERCIRVRLADGTPVEAVRYCFHDWSPSAVWSCRGLPLVPFRTDDRNGEKRPEAE